MYLETIKCLCGETIDYSSNYTAQMISNEDFYEFQELIEHQVTETDEFIRSVYQCSECGRLYIENGQDKNEFVTFVPEQNIKKESCTSDEGLSINGFKIISTPSDDKLKEPNRKVLNSIKGENWKNENVRKRLKESTSHDQTFSIKSIFTDAFRKRTPMYTGEFSLRSIFCYIDTYRWALLEHGFIDRDEIDFHEYTRKKLGFHESTAGWANMILPYSLGYDVNMKDWCWEDLQNRHVSLEEHKKSIELFFRMVDEFYDKHE